MRLRTIANVCTQICVLAVIGAAFCIRMPHVLGFSMEPRIHAGEFVLINTVAYRIGTIRRGDIVAFQHDMPTPVTYLKRVVGLPGDRIEIEHGTVRIDGSALEEPYVRFHDARSSPAIVVPRGALFVMGDNRVASDDSRNWGTVPLHDVIGKAIVTLWPLHELRAP